MTLETLPHPVALKYELDTRPEAFGKMRESNDISQNAEALKKRMSEDGYLVLRNLLKRDDVIKARMDICKKLHTEGFIEGGYDEKKAICIKGKEIGWAPHYAENNPLIKDVVFSKELLSFFELFLGGDIRHFDYIWFRPCSTGINGAPPHCDIVYMGRGTQNLYTVWIPYSDVSYEMGPLMILEDSYRQRNRLSKYTSRDVDTYCTNYPDAQEIADGRKTWQWDGWLTNNPYSLREKYNTRWLTTEFNMGDVLIFSMFTIHAFLDNQSANMRITSDTRYQLASEPIDERWVGDTPIAHGVTGKRGKIC